jgi:peptidyl-tRNA hydrolase
MHDELMLPKYDLKLKQSQGNAGHNGLRSLSGHIQNYSRLRIGIDHPKNFNSQMAVDSYVLSNIDDISRYKDAFENEGLKLIKEWLLVN